MAQSNAAMWSLHLPYVIVQSTTTSTATSSAINCHVIPPDNCCHRHIISSASVGTDNQKMQEIFHKFLKKHYNSTVPPKITNIYIYIYIYIYMRWKGLEQDLSIHTKFSLKNEKKKNYVGFSLCFFFFKKQTDAQRAPYWLSYKCHIHSCLQRK